MAETITIARPYAQAVFAIAQEQGDFSGWSAMLEMSAAVAADADMIAVIDSPRFSKEQVTDLFLEICGDKLNASGKNLIRVLAENGRLELLPEIAALYEVERAAAEGSMQAEVVSAKELNDQQKANIAAALKTRLGRDVTLACSVDETLLGGAIIRAGDLVIDGSAVGKLNSLSNKLLH